MSQKKPLLLYVLTEDWSLFTHRIDLARRAQKAGFRVAIACRVTNHGPNILKEGFDLYPLKNLKRGSMAPLQDLKALYELWALYGKLRPDILHHVALKPVLYGTFAARVRGVYGIVNALGGLGYIFMDTSYKVKQIRKFILFLFKYLFKRKNIQLILQNSDDVNIFQDIIDPDKISLIRGSGVNITKFSPLKGKKSSSFPTILMIGRLLWDKGVGELVDAIRTLNTPRVLAHVQIAGGSDPENPTSIPEHILNKWKEEKILEFLGNREDILEVLHKADIAVLPSYREGLPKGLLEAAACGLPLVATNVPGCREIVQPGINGFLVPPKNAKKLAEALKKLVCDKELREKMGCKSRELVELNFSEEKINNQILEIYTKLSRELL